MPLIGLAGFRKTRIWFERFLRTRLQREFVALPRCPNLAGSKSPIHHPRLLPVRTFRALPSAPLGLCRPGSVSRCLFHHREFALVVVARRREFRPRFAARERGGKHFEWLRLQSGTL